LRSERSVRLRGVSVKVDHGCNFTSGITVKENVAPQV
jgi:hypothetical protein